MCFGFLDLLGGKTKINSIKMSRHLRAHLSRLIILRPDCIPIHYSSHCVTEFGILRVKSLQSFHIFLELTFRRWGEKRNQFFTNTAVINQCFKRLAETKDHKIKCI